MLLLPFCCSQEVNLAVIPSGFSLVRYRSGSGSEAEARVRGGSLVQLFHKEMEGYIAAEGVFGRRIEENGLFNRHPHLSQEEWSVAGEVHLRLRSASTAKPRSLRPPTSAITAWRIEKEASPLSGGDLAWEEHIRFQVPLPPCPYQSPRSFVSFEHATTRQYMMVFPDLSVGLTKDAQNPLTVFRLFPVAKVRPGSSSFASELPPWLSGAKRSRTSPTSASSTSSPTPGSTEIVSPGPAPCAAGGQRWPFAGEASFVSLAESRQARSASMSSLRWSRAEKKPVRDSPP